MKNLNALNLPEDLTLDVQNFIYNAVCSNELMLVFYTPVVNSKLKVLTVVVDKQNYEAVVCKLQHQIDTLNDLEKYDTLIQKIINNLYTIPKYLHLRYQINNLKRPLFHIFSINSYRITDVL